MPKSSRGERCSDAAAGGGIVAGGNPGNRSSQRLGSGQFAVSGVADDSRERRGCGTGIGEFDWTGVPAVCEPARRAGQRGDSARGGSGEREGIENASSGTRDTGGGGIRGAGDAGMLPAVEHCRGGGPVGAGGVGGAVPVLAAGSGGSAVDCGIRSSVPAREAMPAAKPSERGVVLGFRGDCDDGYFLSPGDCELAGRVRRRNGTPSKKADVGGWSGCRNSAFLRLVLVGPAKFRADFAECRKCQHVRARF